MCDNYCRTKIIILNTLRYQQNICMLVNIQSFDSKTFSNLFQHFCFVFRSENEKLLKWLSDSYINFSNEKTIKILYHIKNLNLSKENLQTSNNNKMNCYFAKCSCLKYSKIERIQFESYPVPAIKWGLVSYFHSSLLHKCYLSRNI